MSAAEPEQPEPEKQDLMALLTPEERRFVLTQRAVEVLYQLQETIIHPHWNESYLNLCRGDTGLMAVHCERRRSSAALCAVPCLF